MNYLLDTHTLIWAITEPEKLSARARQLIESPEQHVVVSAVTFWEISLKYALGKLILEDAEPEDFPRICLQMDIEILPLEPKICAGYHRLKVFHHKDPFDRMLIWLAKSENYTIVSKDKLMELYRSEGVPVIW
jgi:PIN domain nuclease of toxin-antitoxin system